MIKPNLCLILRYFELLSYNFSKKSFFCISLSVLISILYNNKKISSFKFAPMDTILHFLGAFFFTLAGGLWENNFFGKLFCVALGISFLFTGGYWNHLLIDKEKDFSIFIFFATFIFGLFIKNYKIYRIIYRIIHLISAIFFI